MINIGIRAHDLGKMDIQTLAEKVSRYGFSSIQLALKKSIPGMDEDRGRLSPGFGNHIRDALSIRGINIAVLGCYINPVHPEPAARQNAIERFTEHLRYARDFGCSVVGTETGSTLPDSGFTGDIYKEETFQEFIKTLKVLVSAAEKTGAIVGIEGVADKNTIFSHERMTRTLEMIPSPNLGVIYDPVNFLPNDRISESNAIMEEAFQKFAPRMVAVHAKDYTVKDGKKVGTLPAGTGMLDYELLFDLIRHYKPWIHVLLENNSPKTIDDTLAFFAGVKGFENAGD